MCRYCEDRDHRDEDGDLEYIGGDIFGDGEGCICGDKIIVYYDGGFGATVVNNIKYCPFCGRKIKE